MSAEPDVVERERTERQFRNQHRARIVQPAHDCRVGLRHAVAEGFSSVSGGNILGVEEILYAIGDAMQRTAVLTGGDLGIGNPGARDRMVFGYCDDRANLSVKPADTIEIDVRESFGCKSS